MFWIPGNFDITNFLNYYYVEVIFEDKNRKVIPIFFDTPEIANDFAMRILREFNRLRDMEENCRVVSVNVSLAAVMLDKSITWFDPRECESPKAEDPSYHYANFSDMVRAGWIFWLEGSNNSLLRSWVNYFLD